MVLLFLSYLGGVLTILSPCILPVLPFVFARADQPFLKSGLPILIGMVLTFALVATLAAVGGGFAVAANDYGRYAALTLVAIFGLTLIFPEISERLSRPVVALGNRLSRTVDESSDGRSNIFGSVVIGIATGLLWAPCAGPILGLILTAAALQGANFQTTLLLLAYSAGAATSLALALVAGGRILQVMKRYLGAGEWVRRGVGVAVLAAAAAIAFGFDTGVLKQLSAPRTAAIEQSLLDALGPNGASRASNGIDTAATLQEALQIEGPFPSLAGATTWLNSPPLTPEALKGKVVLVDFWTYSCINCLRTLPYVRAWAEKYKDQGLVVIGVHTPEFAFEKNVNNVKSAISELKIGYPVAIDNDFAVWRSFRNEYWPAHYFIDAKGNVRHHHFGEGAYEKSEEIIRELLAEAGRPAAPSSPVAITASGAEASPLLEAIQSPETYIGYARAQNFASPGGAVRDAAHTYAIASAPNVLNQWSLAGNWIINPEHAALQAPGGTISYRFHARDLHLVLGPATDGKPIRFKVTLDGKAPEGVHGSDIGPDGLGILREHRLYQLLRQQGDIADHTFEIEFLDPGVQAFAFTFG